MPCRRPARATGLSLTYAFGISLFGGATQPAAVALLAWTGDPRSTAWLLVGAGVIGGVASLALPASSGTGHETHLSRVVGRSEPCPPVPRLQTRPIANTDRAASVRKCRLTQGQHEAVGPVEESSRVDDVRRYPDRSTRLDATAECQRLRTATASASRRLRRQPPRSSVRPDRCRHRPPVAGPRRLPASSRWRQSGRERKRNKCNR